MKRFAVAMLAALFLSGCSADGFRITTADEASEASRIIGGLNCESSVLEKITWIKCDKVGADGTYTLGLSRSKQKFREEWSERCLFATDNQQLAENRILLGETWVIDDSRSRWSNFDDIDYLTEVSSKLGGVLLPTSDFCSSIR